MYIFGYMHTSSWIIPYIIGRIEDHLKKTTRLLNSSFTAGHIQINWGEENTTFRSFDCVETLETFLDTRGKSRTLDGGGESFINGRIEEDRLKKTILLSYSSFIAGHIDEHYINKNLMPKKAMSHREDLRI